jgi:hypothetical protein
VAKYGQCVYLNNRDGYGREIGEYLYMSWVWPSRVIVCCTYIYSRDGGVNLNTRDGCGPEIGVPK